MTNKSAARIEEASVLVRQKKYGEAQRLITLVLKDDEDNQDAWLVRANIAASMRSWPEAATLFSRVVSGMSDGKTKLAVMRRLAEAHRQAGELPEAGKVIADILAQDPEDRNARRELGRIYLDSPDGSARGSANPVFNAAMTEIARSIAAKAEAVLDLSFAPASVLEAVPDVPLRTSVHARRPASGEGITSAKKDFMSWKAGSQKFDVGFWAQGIARVEDPAAAARRMLKLVSIAVVAIPCRGSSVPEEDGRLPEEKQLEEWFDKAPNFVYIAQELTGERRLIGLFDRRAKDRWPSLTEDRFLFRWSLQGSDQLLGTAEG